MINQHSFKSWHDDLDSCYDNPMESDDEVVKTSSEKKNSDSCQNDRRTDQV